MKDIIQLARHRAGVLTSVVADAQAQILSILLYFTILIPFGLGLRLTGDPLKRKTTPETKTYWADRDPVSNELDKAKRQG